jgi:hypothetical protein
VHDIATGYRLPATLAPSHLAYGGTWTVGSQEITAGNGAAIEININAHDVYLVLAGDGTATATLNGRRLATQHVSEVPELHTIVSGSALQHGVLTLDLSPGVKAYDFTFG